MITPRTDVYAAIDSERDYQDKKWGGQPHDVAHSLGDWITYMQHHLNRATEALSTQTTEHNALAAVRKVTALGVACMEQIGAPIRREE